MPNVRLITLPAKGSAPVTINASIAVRRVEIIEDEAATPQGLIFQSQKDNFVSTNTVGPSTEPIILGNPVAQGRGASPILGYPAYNSGGSAIAATPLFKATSATATPTTIRFTEDE